MIDCKKAQGLMPWYANGTLPPVEARELAAHLAGCATCREELATTIRLSLEVNKAISRLSGAPDAVRSRVLPSREVPVARVDLGSFLLGLSLGLSVKGTKVPVQGNLRLFGRKVRLFKIEGGRK